MYEERISLRRSFNRVSPSPIEINGDSKQQQTQASEAVFRMVVERCQHHEPARGHKEESSKRMSGGSVARCTVRPMTEQKQRETGKAEEYEVDGDDIAEDLFVCAGKSNGRCEKTLEQDGSYGYARAYRNARNEAEEQAVSRHGKVDARRRQDALTEETEGGHGDGDRHEAGTCSANGMLHESVDRCFARRQTGGTEDAQANDVHAQINQRDAGNTEQKRAGEVTRGVSHFTGHEAGSLPATIGEQHGHESRSKGQQPPGPLMIGGCRRLGRDGMDGKTHSDQKRYGCDFQDHQNALHCAARTDSKTIHQAQKKKNRSGHGTIGEAGRIELFKVAHESDCYGGHPTGLHDQKQSPAV